MREKAEEVKVEKRLKAEDERKKLCSLLREAGTANREGAGGQRRHAACSDMLMQ